MNTTLDWQLIEEIAASLGVKSRTVEKWRERKAVPGKWQVPIVLASKGRIPLDVFGAEGASA